MTARAFSKHLMEAPEDDESLSEEGKRLLGEGYEDLDAGRVHTLEEVAREVVTGCSSVERPEARQAARGKGDD